MEFEIKNIEKLDEVKANLALQVKTTSSLDIPDPFDAKQIKLVKDAKNGYVKTRGTISRAFKSKRDEYTQKAKENILVEKEVLELIGVEEKRLAEIVSNAEEIIKKEERKKLLPERQEKLKAINTEVSDEKLLEMDEKKWSEYYNEKKEIYLDHKERELQAEKERIEKEEREKKEAEEKKQANEEAEKKRLSDLEDARKQAVKDAEAKAKKDLEDAEQAKNDAVEAERKKAQDEKQKIIDDQKKADEERIRNEERIKFDAEQKKKKEDEQLQAKKDLGKLEEEKTKKNQKYKDWLSKYDLVHDDIGSGAYFMKREGNIFTLCKEIDTITI